MPWFLVGDQFHSHPKVLATEPAALGLWAIAGSWSSDHLTDGVVPDNVLPRLLPDAVKLAEELVDSGLWRRVKGGYKFTGVTEKIPTRKAVENERKDAAERQRRSREARRSHRDRSVTDGASHSAQSNPSPDGYGSAVNQPERSNGRASPEMVDLIMNEIEMATGRRIDHEWAQRTYANIIGRRRPSNPMAYIKSAIRNEPDPRTRFLPLY